MKYLIGGLVFAAAAILAMAFEGVVIWAILSIVGGVDISARLALALGMLSWILMSGIRNTVRSGAVLGSAITMKRIKTEKPTL